MLTENIDFKNFEKTSFSLKKINKKLQRLVKSNNEIISSLSKNYKYSYSKKITKKLKIKNNLRIFGMGGSILGTKAIYDFLRHKIKKNVLFVDNLKKSLKDFKSKNKNINLIISKSGNTLETISNSNILSSKNDYNIFVTEKRNSYLRNFAEKLKAEIVDHNNFIGGRYSVLSEVGMLPAELMGLQEKKFKQFNNLVKNKSFLNSLCSNVSSTLFFMKKKKFNSVILNYDENSESLFQWYQQLIAESLGKKGTGLFPMISSMPRDNHSLLQLYLDGPKNNFFTFFSSKDKISERIKNKNLIKPLLNLKNKNIEQIIYIQKKATQNIFSKKNIPFRSFEIKKRNEKTLGELFCFFILETILLGRCLNVNPYDQPSVELVKTETKKLFSI